MFLRVLLTIIFCWTFFNGTAQATVSCTSNFGILNMPSITLKIEDVPVGKELAQVKLGLGKQNKGIISCTMSYDISNFLYRANQSLVAIYNGVRVYATGIPGIGYSLGGAADSRMPGCFQTLDG